MTHARGSISINKIFEIVYLDPNVMRALRTAGHSGQNYCEQ